MACLAQGAGGLDPAEHPLNALVDKPRQQGRALDRDALAHGDRRLPVKRQPVQVLRHHAPGHDRVT